MMRLAVLTGGGDAPGLNAAIRAVARRAFTYGDSVLGIGNGWQGLLGAGESVELTLERVTGILHVGGTMLGTSRANPLKREGGLADVQRNLARHGVDVLLVIGGDDTQSVAAGLHAAGVKVIGLPKTM